MSAYSRIITWSICFIVVLVTMGGVALGNSPQSQTACADLTAQLSLSNNTPEVNQQLTIVVNVTNQGDASTDRFYTYLYVNPTEQPPLASTLDTTFVGSFGLTPAESFTYEYDYTFTITGTHQIYAWVDRDDQVTGECSENNNLVSLTVPIGIDLGCTLDSFESGAGDDSCSVAPTLTTDGTIQRHNLCSPGDEDWVKFTGLAGVEYTIVAGNVEEDANIVLDPFNQCSGDSLGKQDPILGSGARLRLPIQKSGDYYLKVKHHDLDYGPKTGYDLSVEASCSLDEHEPDNQCNIARSLLPNSTVQRHSFCGNGDADWLTLQTTAGVNYQITTQDWEGNSQPVIALYDSCEGIPVQQMPARAGLNWVAPESRLYRLRVTNSNPTLQGLNTGYGLNLTVLSSGSDIYEPDDAPDQAKLLNVGGAGQTHLIAEPGDQDWLTVDLTANQSYRLETSNLSSATDTYLCLYAPDGISLLGCDDDSGAGSASKLWWQATSSDRYLLKVRHFQPEAGGDHASYQINATTAEQICAHDSFEPDSHYYQAREVTVGGAVQTHTICGGQENTGQEKSEQSNLGQDNDWVRFFVDTVGVYELRASSEGEDADPIIALYDIDGETVLFSNDDYTAGLSARLLWRFTHPGVYYAQVRAFDPQMNGEGTEYRLQISKSQEVPTPLPTTPPPPTPTFTPTFTPSPSPTPTAPPESTPIPANIKTLIVTNQKRMAQFFGEGNAVSLDNKLSALAQYSTAPGVIIRLEENFSVNNAYAEWDRATGDLQKANAVADAVRSMIWDHIQQHPQVEYIVLIGDDRVIPFRREYDDLDNVPKNRENEYAQKYLSATTTVGQALRQNLTLYDDFYASRTPQNVKGKPVFLPEKALGRLVETPQEIIQTIDHFLQSDSIERSTALVMGVNQTVGRQLGQEQACAMLRSLLGNSVVCQSTPPNWGLQSFEQNHLNANPSRDIQIIATAGSHWQWQMGDESWISTDSVTNQPNTLAGKVIVAYGSRTGLNVPNNDLHPLDMPQFYLQRGALLLGNTGRELYFVDTAVGLSHKLMSGFARQLFASQTIGEALVKAKHYYWQDSHDPTLLDRKVLHIATLYALPMTRLPAVLSGGDEFPSVDIGGGLVGVQAAGLITGQLPLNLKSSFAALNRESTANGDYYSLDGHVNWQPDQAGQPLFYLDLNTTTIGDLGAARDVLWVGGIYTDVLGANLLRPQVAGEVVAAETASRAAKHLAELETTNATWSNSIPVQLDPNGKRLSVDMGQYNLLSGTQRLYRQMKFEFTYSDSVDTLAPTVAHSSARVAATGFSVKIEASDASGIRRVLVLYTDRQGQWNQLDLTYQPDSQKWVGSIPGTNDIDWFAQVVDGAGNVTRVLNKTGTFRAVYMADGTASPPAVYLPIVAR